MPHIRVEHWGTGIPLSANENTEVKKKKWDLVKSYRWPCVLWAIGRTCMCKASRRLTWSPTGSADLASITSPPPSPCFCLWMRHQLDAILCLPLSFIAVMLCVEPVPRLITSSRLGRTYPVTLFIATQATDTQQVLDECCFWEKE